MPTPPDPKSSGPRREPDPPHGGASPEGQWPFPARTAGADASPGPDVRQPAADDPEDAGLVDPRPEAAGPDIVR